MDRIKIRIKIEAAEAEILSFFIPGVLHLTAGSLVRCPTNNPKTLHVSSALCSLSFTGNNAVSEHNSGSNCVSSKTYLAKQISSI